MRRGRVAGIVVSGLVLGLLVPACGTVPSDPGGQAAPTNAATSAAPAPTGPATRAPSAAPTPTASPTSTARPSTAPPTLSRGDRGPAVLAWQRQLAAAGYWLGTPDGVFGALTQQATYALEKAAGLSRLGTARASTRAALARHVVPVARTTSGRAVEIDLPRQLLLIVRDGVVESVLNTSTGSGQLYRDATGWHRAVTPRGSFRVYAQIDALRISPLGVLWRPKYFRGGIAVHGAPLIPPWPASHGCVRLSNAAMDRIWRLHQADIGTRVLVY